MKFNKRYIFLFMFLFLISISSVSAHNIFLLDGSNVSCEGLFGSPSVEGTLGYYLRISFKFIKYCAPLLVIVFTTIDYINVIIKSDADAMKNANSRFVKRLIYAILLFIIPTLVDLAFDAMGLYSTCTTIIK